MKRFSPHPASGEFGRPSPHLPVSPSPHLPISPSPHLPISPSPHLPIIVAFCLAGILAAFPARAYSADKVSDRDVDRTIAKGLDWLASKQSAGATGHWQAPEGRFPTAITALSATALLCEGSTTMQGKYSQNIQHAVNYLVYNAYNPSTGLIGSREDDRYTYGHGFSMLFLSQVLGEEEDANRRKELIEVLTKAVKFTGMAQTAAGGWGYVSAKDGGDFDEGSTTITQVQGLRGCRNAGIPVPKEIIEKAVKYIRKCTGSDGGVAYNSRGGGGRPPITAAAIACLFNAGDYDAKDGDKEKVDFVKKMMRYCELNLGNSGNSNLSFGHWHYANYYYSQVLYREGGEKWRAYRKEIYSRLVSEANPEGYWEQGFMGSAYTTAMNLTILQMDRGTLPIYQR
jgi:hypothetical protein